MKLLPPINVNNKHYPKCCAFCKWQGIKEVNTKFGENVPICMRDPEQDYVVLEGELQYHTVCDRFDRENK